MKESILPYWMIKWGYYNAWIFKLGFFVGFLALAIVAHKVKQTRPKRAFRQKLLWVFYSGMFWTGFNVFFYHPYYSNMETILAALPLLATHVHFAWFLVRQYGVGGKNNHDTSETR